MTRPGAATAFDDRFPTQPLAVGRSRVGFVTDARHPHAPDVASRRASPPYRQPPPPRHRHSAPEPARSGARSPRLTILIAVAVVITALIGALGYRTWTSASSWAAPDVPARSVPAAAPTQADDGRRRHAPPRDDRPGDPPRPLGAADGAVPDGLSIFDDDVPAVANLDPALLDALRRAAADAADDRVEFVVNSGWRSREYQEHLLDDAISQYGSKEEAARWVATPDTSVHVSGGAVDIGPTSAAAWLSKHGAGYGLCQVYRNEPWHYELRPDAADTGCPSLYADPTRDPRMQK